jgi:ArsR family transcriptional regulator
MHDLEKSFKALADKNRIRILKLLQHKQMCVCELAYILGITQPSVSRHLKKLKAAGFIDDKQDGFWTNYLCAKPDTPYTKAFSSLIKKWLHDDRTIRHDRMKARKINRAHLCKGGRPC